MTELERCWEEKETQEGADFFFTCFVVLCENTTERRARETKDTIYTPSEKQTTGTYKIQTTCQPTFKKQQSWKEGDVIVSETCGKSG